MANKKLDGTSTTKTCYCGHKSVSGLKPEYTFCPYHYAVYQWGKTWADKCYPEFKCII